MHKQEFRIRNPGSRIQTSSPLGHIRGLSHLLTAIVLIHTSYFLPHTSLHASGFSSDLPLDVERTWIGPEYWTNPMQDWRLNNGRIECVVSGGDRNFHILTHDLSDKSESFEISVTAGKLSGTDNNEPGWIGFKLGAKWHFDDYRARAVYGQGLYCGINNHGRLFIGDYRDEDPVITNELDEITIRVKAEPLDETYLLWIRVYNSLGELIEETSRDDIAQEQLVGGMAAVCSAGEPVKLQDGGTGYVFSDSNGYWSRDINNKRQGSFRYWFKDLSITGDKVDEHEDREFGPVVGTQYTLSKGIMKLTAQLVPASDMDGKEATLQIEMDGDWTTVAKEQVDPTSRTAVFAVENWDDTADMKFRIMYNIIHTGNRLAEYSYPGRIRKDPANRKDLIVAAFTGIKDRRFPHSDLVKNVSKHDPDLLVFTGDQIYESVGGYGCQTEPFDTAVTEYLRKWYLFLWSFGELTRDIPCVTIPDDHDVFHGNLWGADGKNAKTGPCTNPQDNGGYKMPPEFVNMVQRTQTSHLPDPADPRPVQRGIGVYFTELRYGGISFAVIEDRKWKSAPAPLLTKADIYNGFAKNRDFHAPTEARSADASLIGKRQIDFLEKWAADWTGDVWAKAVISQTIFANVATLPEGSNSDSAVPSLNMLAENEYATNDVPVADFDSNGWPQNERDTVIKVIRKACAVHIAGDQHLGSTIQYGVQSFRDSGYALCVPATDNAWPRRWMPRYEGGNHITGEPGYTGDYLDGFGNRMTVLAVSNPHKREAEPVADNSLSPGYGIARFNRDGRRITLAAWPRWVDPDSFGAKPYPGWPVTINLLDNLGTAGLKYLPLLKFAERGDHIVQIIDGATGEIQYTVRVQASEFLPPVYQDGSFTIKVGIPGTGYGTELYNIRPESNKTELNVYCIPKKGFWKRITSS